MASRCFIAMKTETGEVKSIYCHNDGYFAHTGAVLLKAYTTNEKVEELIALGGISFVGKLTVPEREEAEPLYARKGTKKVKHTYNTPQKDVTVAYHRDRGERLVIDTFPSEEAWTQFSKREDYTDFYFYLWKDGQWHVGDELLSDVIQSQDLS